MNVKSFASLISILFILPTMATAEQAWSRTEVGAYRSKSEQTELAFLQEVSSKINSFTKRTGFEACGAISKNGTQFSIIVVSDNVPHGCAIHTTEVEEGFSFTSATIHSHPFQSVLRIDRKAQAWSAEHGVRVQADTLRNDGRSGFSNTDLAANVDSWLVAGNKLHFYDVKTKKKASYDLP